MKPNIQLMVALKEKGWTQREFSKLVGDHYSVVSRVINGWWNLDQERQKRWAEALGCKPGDLFE